MTKRVQSIGEIQADMEQGQRYMELPIGEIIAGQPGQNVRRHFNQVELEGLAQSILDHGIIEPLIVRISAAGYELVAGERRLRAAKLAGLEKVPVMVRTLAPATAAKLQILENLQRRDIDPVEEAEGYQRLIDEHGLKARAIAQDLGVSEGHISNRRRLLRLPASVQQEISREKLSASVALSLVDIAGNPALTAKVATKLIEENATQQRAPGIVDETLAKNCPAVQWAGGFYGANAGRTCDQGAHKDCPCGRRVKPQYSVERVVCIDPQLYAEVEGAAQARIDETNRKALARVEAKADAEDGVLDLKVLKWPGYGRDAKYHDVTSPYDGSSTCTGDHSQCACLRRAKGPHESLGVHLICIDPKQFDRVERAAKKEQTKAAKVAIQSENERLTTWALMQIEELMSEGLATILGQADLAYLAASVFGACEPDYSGPGMSHRIERRAYLEGLGVPWQTNFANLTGRTDLATVLLSQSPEVLLRLVYEWPLLAQQVDSMRALGHWYRGQVDPEVTEAERAATDAALDEIYGDEDESEGDDDEASADAAE